MKIRQVKVINENERLAIVVDNDGLPIDRINFFIMEELRGFADSTVTLRVGMIIHIETWAKDRNIFLEQEMAGTCLSQDGLFTSLIAHLHKKSQNKPNNVVPIKPEQVSTDYFNQRVELCEVYFEYLNNKYLSRSRLDSLELKNNKIFFDKLIKKLKKRIIGGKHNSNVKGLTTLQQASLFRGLKETGFFKWTERTQLRNRLIILMLYETGIRRGELLSLTIKNCHTKVEKPYISIRQNIAHSDSRQNIPQLKTEERIIPISLRLSQLIDDFKVFRSQNKEAKKQPPFLFLTSQEPYRPLSYSSFNDIFLTIKATIPKIIKLSPHVLRHTRFENLDRYMVAKNYSAELKTKIKNNLGGWSRNSKTSENYEKSATEEQVYSVIKGLHDDIDGENY